MTKMPSPGREVRIVITKTWSSLSGWIFTKTPLPGREVRIVITKNMEQFVRLHIEKDTITWQRGKVSPQNMKQFVMLITWQSNRNCHDTCRGQAL